MLGHVVWWDPADMTEETNILGRGKEEEGHVTVSGIGAEIAFNFMEEETEDAETGETTVKKFEKLERFIQFVPILFQLGIKKPVMDYTIIFGLRNVGSKDGSGRVECYQTCTHFSGPWIARLVLLLQYTYVGWACESFMNSEAFGDEDRMEEAHEELAFLLPHIYSDLIDKVLNRKIELLEAKKRAMVERRKNGKALTNEEKEEMEEDERQIVRLKTMRVALKGDEEEDGENEFKPSSLARCVSIRRADLSMDGGAGAGLTRQPSVRLGSSSGAASISSEQQQLKTQFVAGPDVDKNAARVLQDAIKEAKHDPVIHKALQEAVEHPDLEWEGGQTLKRTASFRKASMKLKE